MTHCTQVALQLPPQRRAASFWTGWQRRRRRERREAVQRSTAAREAEGEEGRQVQGGPATLHPTPLNRLTQSCWTRPAQPWACGPACCTQAGRCARSGEFFSWLVCGSWPSLIAGRALDGCCLLSLASPTANCQPPTANCRPPTAYRNMYRALGRYQRALLYSAVRLLKPGGVLVYCTCTINPGEATRMHVPMPTSSLALTHPTVSRPHMPSPTPHPQLRTRPT